MGFVSSMKKGFQEANEEKTLRRVNNFEYKKTELENKIKDAKVNHILHLILSIITAGIWIIVWILVTISASSEKSAYNKELQNLYRDKKVADGLVAKKQSTHSSSNSSIDAVDQLAKLAELLDNGHLTQEEFEQQKSKLLS